MKFILSAFVVALTLLFCSSLLAEDKPWIEVCSPHFRLMSNGSEHDGRQMVRQFELIRAVFESQFPGFKLETPAPLLIIAAKDEYTAKQLLPQIWAHPGPRIAGLYEHGWEREYAVVRLDQVISDRIDPDTYHVVYHEYIHSLLHANFHWLPSWLDEGLAEFYGYTRFEKDKMYVGAPPRMAAKVEFLQEKNSIPLAKFISSRVFSRDEEQTQLSYMQAWGLTHFLTFGPGMQNGQLLKRFFNELQRGVEQQEAFVETFGSLDDVQTRYEQYLKRFSFTAATLPVPARIEESDYTARNTSLAETHAELAAWHIRFHHWEQVRELTEASLKEDPKLSLAHEDNGFLQFNEGKDDEALKEFSAAVDLDSKDYIALFAKIMTSPASRSNDPKDHDATYHGLESVLDLKPDFAPAYVELAKIAVSKGQMPLALGLSRKAEQLEPFRSGYHLLSGEILLRMNRAGDAASEAAYVAQRWGGSDRDEALELLNSVPLEKRPAEVPAISEVGQKWQTAAGTVKSVSCNGHAFGITLDVNGQPQTFKSTGFPVGFSDTLWVGHDHFSPCFHVQGLRAMLRYKVSKDPSYTGDLIYVGFRDDLGPQISPATTQASAR
jgi:tetratricopeptide (TPR) repeat protein